MNTDFQKAIRVNPVQSMKAKRIRDLLLVTFLATTALFADPSPDGSTPLIQAVHDDRTDEALTLIESGADVSAKNEYGVSALPLACRNGNTKLIEALLEAGANPNTSLPGGETALLTAARTGLVAPVKVLLAHGARIDATERKKQTALMWAAAEGHAEVVGVLIEAGADPGQALESGFTPLLFAARDGHKEVAAVLLAAGVDVGTAIEVEKAGSKAPPQGTTALRLAVENGHFELAIFLLESGADPNDFRSGNTPLHILTWVRKPHRGDGESGMPPPEGSGNMTSLQFAKRLIEDFGADVNLSQGSGKKGRPTPFFMAATRADLDYMKLLHELGADPTLTNQNGTTPLLAVAGVGSRAPEEEAGSESERLATLDWLLELGADVNTVDRGGETAMHGAAYKNVPKVAEWLDKNGADIEVWNQKNKKRWTPLLIAQGFRPGNFKPDFATIEAIEKVMRANGVDPPPAPKRPVVGKPKKYEP